MSIVGNEERCGSLPIAEGIVNPIKVWGETPESEIKLGTIIGLRQGVQCGERLAIGLLEAGDTRTGETAPRKVGAALREVLFPDFLEPRGSLPY